MCVDGGGYERMMIFLSIFSDIIMCYSYSNLAKYFTLLISTNLMIKQFLLRLFHRLLFAEG